MKSTNPISKTVSTLYAVATSRGLREAVAAVLLWSVASTAASLASESVWLDSLDLKSMRQGWGTPGIRQSVTGGPLSINGAKFAHGVGTHAPGHYTLDLRGTTERFTASVGVDDNTSAPGSVVFQLQADGRTVFDSGIMRSKQPAKQVSVNLKGLKTLVLRVTDAGDGRGFDHADWGDARFEINGEKPAPIAPDDKPYFLTPVAGPAPRINGPLVYGAHPGNPFLYRIPTQGKRPISFAAKNLPDGLRLDSNTGIISGVAPAAGEYSIALCATNAYGGCDRSFKLAAGDQLSLTPSMGWNSWYAHYGHVTDKLMREAADAMVSSGMADVGYEYVNIDDCWMNAERNNDPTRVGPPRGAAGNLLPNQNFPDMKALADYIHSKGLKAGLYTSPGPKTCAGYTGAYQHEAQDASLFASWGFDFLKYDWCTYSRIASNPPTLEQMKRPYLLMGGILKQQKRDILLNLCQYGMGDVWKWGLETGGQSWRTSGDLGGELNRIFQVALANCEHRDWQKLGAWNDPDYIQIGFIGDSHAQPVPSPFTPTEAYSFMSLWSLMASPLFYSGHMESLDKFTLNVLCNPEVIEIDQDPKGECARVLKIDDDRFIMVKDMADGSKAVGLGNSGDIESSIAAEWSKLGFSGHQQVRDVWRAKPLGLFKNKFEATVPAHGVVLIRVSRSQG